MGLKFTKMHGLGNDFMIINATVEEFNLSSQQIQRLADRHRGVGFDQLLIIASTSSPQADFIYRIFNSDGSEAEQCGNGARCVARFIHAENLSSNQELRLLTGKKITRVYLAEENEVIVEMDEPQFAFGPIPYTLIINNESVTFTVVNVGNPHAVIQVSDVSQAQVEKIGTILAKHPNFPQGTNVGFMQIINGDQISLRVFERGVGETLACGSGACAAVAVGRLQGLLDEQVKVTQVGGDFLVQWQGLGSTLKMKGPAEFVYKGEIS